MTPDSWYYSIEQKTKNLLGYLNWDSSISFLIESSTFSALENYLLLQKCVMCNVRLYYKKGEAKKKTSTDVHAFPKKMATI